MPPASALQGFSTTPSIWQLTAIVLNQLLTRPLQPLRPCLQPPQLPTLSHPSSQPQWPVNTLIVQGCCSSSSDHACRQFSNSLDSSSSHQGTAWLLAAGSRLLSRTFGTSSSAWLSKRRRHSGTRRVSAASQPTDDLLQQIKSCLTYLDLEEVLEGSIPRLAATHLAAAATQAARLHAQHQQQQDRLLSPANSSQPVSHSAATKTTTITSSSSKCAPYSRVGAGAPPPDMRQVAVAATRQRQLSRLLGLLERMCVVAARRLDLGPFAHLLYAATKTGYLVSAELQQAVAGMLLHTTLPQSAAIAGSGATTGVGAAAGVGTEDVAAGPAQNEPQHPHQHSQQQQQQQQQQWAIRPLTGRAGLPPALLSARGYEVTMAAWAWSQLEGASPRVLHLLLEAGLQKLPQLSLVSMAQLLTAAQRAGAGSPLLLRRVVRQALALRPWDHPGHLLYLMGALQRLEQDLKQPADVQLWAAAAEALRSASQELPPEQQAQAARLLAAAQQVTQGTAVAGAAASAPASEDPVT